MVEPRKTMAFKYLTRACEIVRGSLFRSAVAIAGSWQGVCRRVPGTWSDDVMWRLPPVMSPQTTPAFQPPFILSLRPDSFAGIGHVSIFLAGCLMKRRNVERRRRFYHQSVSGTRRHMLSSSLHVKRAACRPEDAILHRRNGILAAAHLPASLPRKPRCLRYFSLERSTLWHRTGHGGYLWVRHPRVIRRRPVWLWKASFHSTNRFRDRDVYALVALNRPCTILA